MIPPLLYPLLALLAGLIWPMPPAEPLNLLLLIPALGLALFWPKKWPYPMAPMAILMTLSFYYIGAHLAPSHQMPRVDWPSQSQNWHAQALDSTRRLPGERLGVTIALSPSPGAPARPVILVMHDQDTPIFPGDRLFFKGKIKSPRHAHNPGERNRERYYAHQGITGRVSIYRSDDLAIFPDANGFPFYRQLWDIRQRLRQFFLSAPDGISPMLLAMLLGDRSQLSEAMRGIFTQSGLAHVLAISGLHITGIALLIQGGLLAIFRRIRAYFPRLRRSHAHYFAAGFALLFATAYALLAGLPISARRALFMCICLLTTRARGRNSDPLGALILTALILLLLRPQSLWELGFQLSFASVGALLLWGSSTQGPEAQNEVANGLIRGLSRIYAFIKGSLRASTVAILGTAPLLLYHFQALALIGPISNILGVLLLGTLSVPLGLLSGVFHLLHWDFLAQLTLEAVSHPLEWGLMMAQFFAQEADFSYWNYRPSPLHLCLMVGILLCAGFYRLRARLPALLLLIITPLMALYFAFSQGMDPPPFTLTQLAVGHGDSLFIQSAGGQTLLVDGGGATFSRGQGYDPGERQVLPALKAAGVERIDIMIMSHPDNDHYRGLLAIAEALPVDEFWMAPPENGAYSHYLDPQDLKYKADLAKLLARIEEGGGLIRQVGAGFERDWQGAQIQVLHPSPAWPPKGGKYRTRRPNNGSLVLKLGLGPFSLLLTGDLEAEGEAHLLQNHANLAVDILKVAHHGSSTSSTEAFLAATQPQLALLSVGRHNRFNLPKASVLARLEAIDAQVLRTDIAAHQIRFYDDKMGIFRHKTGEGWQLKGWRFLPCGPLPPFGPPLRQFEVPKAQNPLANAKGLPPGKTAPGG